MNCWFCGRELIWNNDYDVEDYNIERKEGIVSVLTCSNDNCKAIWEGYLFNE